MSRVCYSQHFNSFLPLRDAALYFGPGFSTAGFSQAYRVRLVVPPMQQLGTASYYHAISFFASFSSSSLLVPAAGRRGSSSPAGRGVSVSQDCATMKEAAVRELLDAGVDSRCDRACTHQSCSSTPYRGQCVHLQFLGTAFPSSS